MADYIKREDAINELCRRGCEAERDGKLVVSMCEAKQFAVNVLDDIPAADVRENVRGKWIHTDCYPHKVYCSVCFNTYLHNEKWAAELPITLHPQFCPSCGADMRGKKDGNQ